MKKNACIQILLSFLLTAVIVFTYRNLIHSFFEQDEWGVWASMIIFNSYSFLDKMKFLFSSSGVLSHFIPFTTCVSYFFYQLFGLHAEYYFIISIVIHVINSLLVFKITKKLTDNNVIAFVAGLFFGIHRLSSQVVIWLAASIGAELSTVFLLASFLIYLYYLDKKQKKLFVLAVITFLFSIFSKETSLSLVIFFPILYLMYKNIIVSKKLLTDFEVRKTFLFPLFVGLFFLFKLVLLYINPFIPPAIDKVQHAPAYFLLFRILFYPLLALSQIYDWNGVLFSISKGFLLSEYPYLSQTTTAPHLIETIVPDVLYLIFSSVLIILFFILLPLLRKTSKKLSMLAIGSIIGFVISILPYVPLPRSITFLELRYYYTPNIFASMFLGICVFLLVKILFKGKYTTPIVLLFGIIAVVVNYNNIQLDIAARVATAHARREVLSQFKKQMPHLPSENTVMFVTGTGADYLIPDLKIPFQSGFGNILLVFYYDSRYLTPKILDNGFLYQLEDQGYQKVGKFGFGYYYQEKVLLRDLKQNKFTVDNVYGFSWNQEHEKLSTITDSLRKELQVNIHEKN